MVPPLAFAKQAAASARALKVSWTDRPTVWNSSTSDSSAPAVVPLLTASSADRIDSIISSGAPCAASPEEFSDSFAEAYTGKGSAKLP